jgi:hypothetical protein
LIATKVELLHCFKFTQKIVKYIEVSSDQIIVCSLNDSYTTVSLKKVIAVLASPVSLSYPNSLEKGGWIMYGLLIMGFQHF